MAGHDYPLRYRNYLDYQKGEAAPLERPHVPSPVLSAESPPRRRAPTLSSGDELLEAIADALDAAERVVESRARVHAVLSALAREWHAGGRGSDVWHDGPPGLDGSVFDEDLSVRLGTRGFLPPLGAAQARAARTAQAVLDRWRRLVARVSGA
jgi:hypothetical protein